MSAGNVRPGRARGSPPARLARVWQALPSERRLAAGAAIGLFLTLFLPWYQETVIAGGVLSLHSLSTSLTGWGAFSFVEAAVLLVAIAVLVLLFIRAEGGAFHVPGGDGGVITAAGVWTCALIVWRIFDKQGTSGQGQVAMTSGIEWGIFVALAVAALLAYAGSRIRQAHDPEPPLPGELADIPTPAALDPAGPERRAAPGRAAAPTRAGRSRRTARATEQRPPRIPEMGIDDTWTQPTQPLEPPRRRIRPRSIISPGGRAASPRTPPQPDRSPSPGDGG